MKMTLKIGPPLQFLCVFFCPPHIPLKNYLNFFLMTSHLDSHTTTYVKPEMIPGVLTGNGIPHDKYDVRSIAHAQCTHRQKRRHFHAKTTIY